ANRSATRKNGGNCCRDRWIAVKLRPHSTATSTASRRSRVVMDRVSVARQFSTSERFLSDDVAFLHGSAGPRDAPDRGVAGWRDRCGGRPAPDAVRGVAAGGGAAARGRRPAHGTGRARAAAHPRRRGVGGGGSGRGSGPGTGPGG